MISTQTSEKVSVWNLKGSKTVKQDFIAPGQVCSAALNPQGGWLAVGFRVPGALYGISVWNITMHETVVRLTPKQGKVQRLHFSPDGGKLICECDDGPVIHDTSNFRVLWSVVELSSVSALTDDHSHFAFTNRQLNVVRLWNISTNRQRVALRHLLTLPEQESYVHCLTWSPDNNLLVVGRADGTIAIWNIESLRSQLAELHLDW